MGQPFTVSRKTPSVIISLAKKKKKTKIFQALLNIKQFTYSSCVNTSIYSVFRQLQRLKSLYFLQHHCSCLWLVNKDKHEGTELLNCIEKSRLFLSSVGGQGMPGGPVCSLSKSVRDDKQSNTLKFISLCYSPNWDIVVAPCFCW